MPTSLPIIITSCMYSTHVLHSIHSILLLTGKVVFKTIFEASGQTSLERFISKCISTCAGGEYGSASMVVLSSDWVFSLCILVGYAKQN